jgi:hypothetical protein
MTSQQRAKHAEIKRRYARKFQQQPLPDRLAAMGRAEIRRLIRYRLGSKPTRFEIDQHIIARLGDDWELCLGHELANRMLQLWLTLEERMRLDIRRFPATDVSRAQQKEAYRKRRLANHRERARIRRASTMKTGEAAMKACDLSIRRETLLFLLKATGRWLDVPKLAEAVKEFAAWRCPDGSRLTPASLQTLIRRELDALEADGHIKQKRVVAKRGGLTKRVAKWIPKGVFAQTIKHFRVRTKKTIDEMGTTLHVSNADPSACAHDSYLPVRTHAGTTGKGLSEHELLSHPRSLTLTEFATIKPSSDTRH